MFVSRYAGFIMKWPLLKLPPGLLRTDGIPGLSGFRTRYPIALDLFEGEIQALQLQKTVKGLGVKAIFRCEAEEAAESSGAGGPACWKRIRKSGFSGRSAVAHVPAQDISVFPIRFQIEGRETLEGAIVRESRRHLPFQIEEAVLDYPCVTPCTNGSEAAESYKAIVIAVHREKIKEYLAEMEKTGFIVEALEYGVCSLIRLHSYLHTIESEPVILCHIGRKNSIITVANRESILGQRTISFGFDAISDRIASNFGLSGNLRGIVSLLKKYGLAFDQETKTDRKKEGENSGVYRAFYQVITPRVDEMIHEVHKLVSYVRAEGQNPAFKAIYFYGYGALINGLEAYVEKRMNIPVKSSDPFSGINPGKEAAVDEIPQGAPVALMMGLALRKVPWV